MASQENLQLSCLQLAFYLASWGMLRGSTELLQKSSWIYVPVIQVISRSDLMFWDIDAHNYSSTNINAILDFKLTIITAFKCAIKHVTDTLVTKRMLGVFGNVPAFDTYFKKGFKEDFAIGSLNKQALEKVQCIYKTYKTIIEEEPIYTLDFQTGEPTNIRYPRAKVIDIIGFMEGKGKSAFTKK